MQQGTISFWINWDVENTIFSGNSDSDGYLFYQTTTLNWGGDYLYFTDVFNTHEWIHIVIIRDGTNLSIYKNGVYQETKDNGVTSTMKIKCIGRKYCEGILVHWLDGTLDEVMFYNRVLSDQEIQAIYCDQGGSAGFC